MTDTLTTLDIAYQEMTAAPGDEPARLRFFGVLAGTEFSLLLQDDAGEEDIRPVVYELETGAVLLAFDTAERLVAFTGTAAASATLPGRQLVSMLEGQGIGLAINPDLAPSSTVLEPAQIDWLATVLNSDLDEQDSDIRAVKPPADLSEPLLRALDTCLARAAGLARFAYLVRTEYEDDEQGLLLAMIDPAPGAEPALARAVGEAFAFSGEISIRVDAGFFEAGDPTVAQIAAVGLRFDLPEPDRPDTATTQPPGSDPDKPPILR